MSFTNNTLIKKHLLDATRPMREVKNFPVTLVGTDDYELPHRNLEENSVTVKWIRENSLTQDGPLTLNDYDTASFSQSNIVPQSIVAAPSDTLNTIYVDEADYKVDHESGKVNRVVGTAIPNNQPVMFYYEKFTLFTAGVDYEADTGYGVIHRISDGDIPDGATVLADYTLGAGLAQDELIDQTVLEVQDLIARFLSPSYNNDSTDQGLQTGATELALSMLTRDMASSALLELSVSDSAARAKQWLELSNFYESKAYRTLGPFLSQHSLHTNLRRNNSGQSQ